MEGLAGSPLGFPDPEGEVCALEAKSLTPGVAQSHALLPGGPGSLIRLFAPWFRISPCEIGHNFG